MTSPTVCSPGPDELLATRGTDVVLRDGSTVHIRPASPADEPGLVAFYAALSPDSRLLRFFSVATDLSHEVHRELGLDARLAGTLVATTGSAEHIVGHAFYSQVAPARAEVALAVADAYQGRGLGTLLLGQLAEHASQHGIPVLEAVMLAQNYRVLDVFRESGFLIEQRAERDLIHLSFPTTLTDQARARFAARERIAAVSALRHVLEPRSVAVIGASRRRGTVGGEVLHHLLGAEFSGTVDPVNPAAQAVQGVRAYPSVDAIPGEVDLAIVAVPAERVVEVARQCAAKGVHSLVVLSAGFAETDAAGRARQAALLEVCRAAGMRLVGPNCLGVLNTDPAVRLDGIFAGQVPAPGPIAFASQSGALGLAALDLARGLDLGLSSFVSLGNRADISNNDLLSYWADDPRTRVILLYLESFGNPRAFGRIAQQVGRSKPIVALKSGRSPAGARASASHTGALLEGSDVTVDALFQQAGVIRVETLDDLFGTAALLADQPLPAGRRVGIVTNIGGPAIMCTDALVAAGLEVPVLSQPTQAQLRTFLPAAASVTNPVDMIATATAEQYRQTIEVLARDPDLDALVVMFIPPLKTTADEVAAAIAAAVRAVPAAERKPLVVMLMGSGTPSALRAPDVRVPVYTLPEAAASALAHAVRYAEWRRSPVGARPPLTDVRPDEATALVAAALGRGAGWLEPAEVAHLLACYGLPVVEQRIVDTPEAAGGAAAALGGPVALKAVASGLIHKTEQSAVQLNLVGGDAVRAAAAAMATRLGTAGVSPSGFVIQRMAAPGVEMLVGVVHDPHFGPLIACGGGGVLVELLKDVSVRLAPVAAQDALEMIQELRVAPLLAGYRGAPVRDTPALQDVLLRLSALVDDLPQIAELDCNPVIVHERSATIVDARVRVEPLGPPPPLGAR